MYEISFTWQHSESSEVNDVTASFELIVTSSFIGYFYLSFPVIIDKAREACILQLM